ncbi:DUF551 domain-containing protein [Cronobacter dublinensis]
MSTISNELVKDLRMAFAVWQQDYDPVEDKEQYDMFGLGVVAMDELLALRKERERAEPVGEVVLGSRDEEGNYPHAHVICLAGEGCADWDNFPDGFKLYTAPPDPVEHEDDSEIKWRELALQFDGHRMQAICFLKQILKEFPETEFSSAREFLKSGPLSGEEVLRNRIAALAQPATIAHDERYQQLSELYHAQEKRLFKLAQRIKGPSFDKYAHSPSQAIDVLEVAIFGENDDACRAAMLNQSQQFESLAGKAVVTDENGNLPCPFCGGRCDPNGWMGSYDDGVPMCGPECEDCGATASSIEEWNRRSTALAGKAVVPEGWKLVPMRLTAENGAKGALSGEFSETKFVNCHECFGDGECETCDGSGRIEITVPVTWSTIKEIWAKGVEHFATSPQSPGNDHATVSGRWIPCSERMPVEKDIVLVVDDGYFVCEAQYREGDFFSAARGSNEFFETICRDVEFWQPLPEPPCK